MNILERGQPAVVTEMVPEESGKEVERRDPQASLLGVRWFVPAWILFCPVPCNWLSCG